MISRLFKRLMNTDGFRLGQFPATIGRSDESDVCIMDRFVSRWHCRVEIDENRFFVSDLGSRHGTRINGERIERAELQGGDVLQIGLLRFFVNQSGRALLLRKVRVPHLDDSFAVGRQVTNEQDVMESKQNQSVH